MHRKAIAASSTSRQSRGTGNPFRASGLAASLFQNTSHVRYNRQSSLKFCFFPFVCLFSVTTLFAALDPDIFDGRITEPSSVLASGSTAGSPESSGGKFEGSGNQDGSVGVVGTEGDEQGDLESVGGAGGGESVESYSSKDASSRASTERAASDSRESTAGGGAYGKATSKDEASLVGSGSGGSSSTEASGEPSGDSSFASQDARNFEDFGFGGAGMPETIEVNRSKESTTPTGLLSGESTTPPKLNDLTTAAGQGTDGDSQATNGSLGGDYGTKLPSGL
jgi:hypothetical protein